MAILSVSNQGELNAAVIQARGGDTILLGPGTYDELLMNTSKGGHGGVNFPQNVTIASADPGRPAVINEMLLRGAGNIEIRNLKFDYVPGKSDSAPFTIQNSRNITLDNVDLEGQVSGAFGSGIGLRVSGSQNVTLVNSDVSGFRNGLFFSGSSDVTISGNDFSAISNDGMLLGGLVGAVIAGNDFRGMKSSPSLKHKDMIQFYNGSGELSSRNIVIRSNTIENPEESHAIFFGNAMAKGGNIGAYYQNILIEDNYIRTAHLHGITIDHGAGVTIRDNTVLNNPDQGHRSMVNIPLINVSSRSVDVDIVGNRVASVPEDRNPTWTVAGNVTTGQNVQHWAGNYGGWRPGDGAGRDDTPDDDTPAEETPDEETIGGGGRGNESFRVSAGQVDGRLVVGGVDFAADDVIVFRGFDRGTFLASRGKNQMDIWDDAGAVKVDSATDLQELVRFSSDITASTSGDDLVLRIREDGDIAEIVLDGVAAAFRAAAQPELF